MEVFIPHGLVMRQMEEALNATTLLLKKIIWRKICGNLNIFAKDAGNNGDTLVQSGIMILN